MFFFVNLWSRGNNGTGGSFSIQIPTSSSSLWSGAHVVRGIKKKRARVGESGRCWVRSNEEERRQQGSSSDKPTFKLINHISKGIKAAFAAFQGWKFVQKLHVASPEGTFGAGNWVWLSVKATKFVAKSLKVSQKVLSKLNFKSHPAGAMIEKVVYKDLAPLANGCNAFYAAIKVVQFTEGLGRQPQQAKLPDGDSIWKGYKFSKSLLTILDPVAGENGWAFTHAGKGFLVFKTTVGGIGVVVKAALLSKELCIAVLQKLAISGGTSAASLRRGYHIGMLVDKFPRNKPKRLSCTAIIKEGDFSNMLSASFHRGSLSNDSLFSLILLLKSFAEDTKSPFVKFCEDDHQFIILCLSIPLPSSEILVFV